MKRRREKAGGVGARAAASAAASAAVALIGALGGVDPAAAATASPRAQIDARTGAITIIDAGRGRIRESAVRGPGPGGRLGFSSGGRWYHATRLLNRRGEGRGTSMKLATDDPAGRTLAVRLTKVAAGVLALDARIEGGGPPVDSTGIGFGAAAAERMLGFGERSNRVDQRGNTVVNFVGEGPFQEAEYRIVDVTIPDWGILERRDASYFPMPWMLSTRGYGVLADNLQTSRFRLGTERGDEWSLEVDAPRLRLRFFAGPKPKDVVRRLTEATGRQPAPEAPWIFGPWFQTGHQNTETDELEKIGILRDADAPISAVESHMRYMPCGSDQGAEAGERRRTRGFHRQGLAALTYTREAICESYSGPFDRAAAGAFLERGDGTPYTFQAFVGGGVTQIGMLDFSDPAAGDVYASILDRAYGAGYDGWMEDYGEYAPPDSVAANGMGGKRMHNRYPVLYHREGQRYADSKDRPVVRFTRSGWTGAHRHSQIVWGGDPTTGWGFDGLSSSVKEALTMGLSGISTWGSDIGGFFTLSGQVLTPELLARWIQFGAFSGVMRTKAEGIGVPRSARPQIWEEPTLPIWRRYAKLRTQLYPYLVAADAEYRRTGMPIMRQLALTNPRDRRAVRREDEFMFGDDLLVAPVTEPGERSRKVYLPRGRWIDFWDSISYRERDGELRLSGLRTRRGAATRRIDARLEEIPLQVRPGALLPLLPADVETLAPYAKGNHVGLEDRRDRLHVLAFPRGRSKADFYESSTLRSSERKGSWRLAVDSRRPLTLEVEASMKTLERPFVPRRISVDGRRLRKGWSYSRESGVLRIRARLADGVISVAPHRR